MRMNTMIPLSVQNVDVPNALMRGAQTAGAVQAFDQRNKLFPGEMQQQQQRIKLNDLQIQSAQQAMRQRAAAAARAGQAAQLAAEAAELEKAIKLAIADPTKADEIYKANGLDDYVGMDARDVARVLWQPIMETVKDFGPQQPDTEADREIQRLVGLGVPKDVAVKLKEGVYRVVSDPVTGESVILDLATRQTVGRVDMTPSDTDRDAATDTPAFSFGNQFDTARSAGGVGGVFRGVANTAADAVGAPMPFPETADAQLDFKNFGENIIATVAMGYDRQPPSWLLQNIKELAPQPGITEGAEGSRRKFEALGREILTRREALAQSARRRMKPADREKIEAKIAALDAAMFQIQRGIDGLQAPSLQIRPEVADRLKDY